MEGIMKYVMETYGFLIQTTEDGKKIAYNEMIDCLDLTPQEKAFIRLTFRTFGAEIVNREKEEITEESRSERVRDYNYGDVESHGLESFDKPAKAEVEYEDEQLVFENYEELDKYIINEFIPNNVRMKVLRAKNSRMEIRIPRERLEYDGETMSEPLEKDPRKMYPSIRLSDIVKLKLSEKEVEHVLELLKEKGIRVGGTSQDLDSEFLNYDYVRTYASKRYEKPLSAVEEREKFNEYYETHDPLLKEELIVRNLRLVPFVAWKLALRHNMEQEELESFGYEGLIYAIDKYDPNMKARFATYAIPCIAGYIKKSIPKIKDIPHYLYYDFQSVCYIVEKEWGKKYDGDPEMLKEILEVMYAEGMICSEVRCRELYKYFLSKKAISLDQLQEEEIDLSSQATIELEGSCFANMMKDMLHDVLDTLTPREQKVLEMRFGIKDGHQRNLEEVAKEFNVTRERIRQIEAKALRKLRHPSRAIKLRGFFESLDEYRDDDNDQVYLYDESEDVDSKTL